MPEPVPATVAVRAYLFRAEGTGISAALFPFTRRNGLISSGCRSLSWPPSLRNSMSPGRLTRSIDSVSISRIKREGTSRRAISLVVVCSRKNTRLNSAEYAVF